MKIFFTLMMSCFLGFSALAETKKVLKHPNLEKRYIVVDTDVDLIQSSMNQEASREVKIKDLMTAMKEGPGVGGGGFSYTRGAVKHITATVTLLINFLNGISNEEFLVMQSQWKFKFPSRSDLVAKILDMRLSTTEQTYAQGLLGLEPLMADFRIISANKKYVILQKKLFDTFNNETDLTAQESILRIVLHEMTHLYRIGLNNDEESYALSTALSSRILATQKLAQELAAKELIKSSKTKKINLIQVIRATDAELNASYCCSTGIEEFALVEIAKDQDNTQARFAIHAAHTGSSLGYDSDQWKVIGQNVCSKLGAKLGSPLKWTMEYDNRLESTYGTYCIGR